MPNTDRKGANSTLGETPPPAPTLPVITLLTDFGTKDTYVGQMKGAILSLCPHAVLVDLSHDIPPGDIIAGAVAWCDAVAAFPPRTIHVGVVDPGVGTLRRAIAAEIGPWRFVGPDNGLITEMLKKWPMSRAVELTESRWWRPDVSAVFHGRDIFGPVAAHWAAGRELMEFGPPIESLVQLDIAAPSRDGISITGCILTIDRFGNLRTNIPQAWLTDPVDQWRIEIGPETIYGVSRCFGDRDAGALVALIGSHGHLEIAINRGHAAERLPASVGMPVHVHKTH